MNRIVFAAYAAFVGFMSLQPSTGPSIAPWDKLQHFAVYFAFALLGYRLIRSPRGFLLVCLGIIAYSGLLEFAQSFTATRTMSAYDLVANALGVALGAALMLRRR